VTARATVERLIPKRAASSLDDMNSTVWPGVACSRLLASSSSSRGWPVGVTSAARMRPLRTARRIVDGLTPRIAATLELLKRGGLSLGGTLTGLLAAARLRQSCVNCHILRTI
jgi:hypothetical protein